MARARIIKPGFYKNEQLAECSLLARFIFPGLWMLADRRGRLEDRPKRLKAELLPYDDADTNALLDELATQGLILRYEHGGLRLIQIVEFEKHQNCHVREPESAYPAPGEHGASTVPAPDEHQSGPADTEALTPNLSPEAENGTRKRAAPLAAPTEAHEQLAREVGVSCQAEFEKFRDWLAASGTRPRDYGARFRMWLRKAGEFKARDAPKRTVHDKRSATARAMYGEPDARQPTDITAEAERLA